MSENRQSVSYIGFTNAIQQLPSVLGVSVEFWYMIWRTMMQSTAMVSILLPLYFTFAAVWLGCVITEALFERALLTGGRSSHLVLADLHVRVDKLIEIPAIAIVLLTGFWPQLQREPQAEHKLSSRSLTFEGCLSPN